MQQAIAIPGGIRICAEHALYVRDEDALTIADLHLGYEAELQAQHVSIPRFQLEPMLERIDALLARYRPERFIINGDMKHAFDRNKPQEWDEVEAVLDRLEGIDVTVVRGNHDNYLRTILARRNIEMVDSLELCDGALTLLHGHLAAPGEGLRVFAHEHPVIRFRDEVGAQVTHPCFLYEEAEHVLVMPAFSPLASGTNVISPEESFMSPGLRTLDLSGARVFVIHDGIMEFGTVGTLRDMRDEALFQMENMKLNYRRR